MPCKQCDCQPIHPKGYTSRVGGLSIGGLYAPGQAEMVAVAIEAHAGGRRLGERTGISISNLSAFFTWKRPTICPSRPKNGSLAASMRCETPRSPAISVARAIHWSRNAEILFRRSDGDKFPHSKRLEPVDVLRRFATKAITGHIEQHRLSAGCAALRRYGVDRVAGCRRQHEFARLRAVGPAAASLVARYRLVHPLHIRAQRADATQKMREAFQVSRLLDQRSANDGWEAEHLRPLRSQRRNVAAEAVDHVFIYSRAAIDAVNAHRCEQARQHLFGRGGEFVESGVAMVMAQAPQ